MSMSAIGAYVCRALQTNLLEYFGKNAPQYRTLGSVSLIKWLLSPQNTANFKRIEVESIPGKKRAVAFMVNDPYCFQVNRVALDCTVTPAFVDPESKEVVFDLDTDPFTHIVGDDAAVLRFTEDDLMKYCTTDNTSWIQEQIFRYLLRFEEALDKKLAVLLETQIGTNAKGEAVTRLPLFVQNQNLGVQALNPNAVWYLNQTFSDIGLDGQYAMLGGVLVNKIAAFNKWRALNEAGVDMSKTNDLNPYAFYNRNFDGIYGQNDFLIMAPGTAQLVTWNRYKGEKRRKVTDLYTHGTIVLPTTGLEVDYKWSYDEDCEVWKFKAFLHAELATVPAGGCSDADNGVDASGVNGIMKIEDCSPVGVVPSCPGDQENA